MIVEWKFAAFMATGQAIHNYHGICNQGVGWPYKEFVHQLRTIAESGDTHRLTTVLRRADEHSRDIFDVWLGIDADGADLEADAYKKSIDEILK